MGMPNVRVPDDLMKRLDSRYWFSLADKQIIDYKANK